MAQCLPKASCRHAMTLGIQGFPVALGERTAPSMGVRARLCVTVRGQQARPGAAWQRSVKMFRARCALCGAACSPGGLLTPAESRRDPCCLCALSGFRQAGWPCGWEVGRRLASDSLSSQCLRGAWGPGVREPLPPARLPQEQSLGSLSLASYPTHSWCTEPGFCGGQNCGFLSSMDRRF